jgi:signal transduction histidine kinase/ActR/RegA family two-component response regulator
LRSATDPGFAVPVPTRWIIAGVVLLAVLLALELSPLPRVQTQKGSDWLQFCLAVLCSLLCGRTAFQERSLGRAFWLLIGLGCLVWSAGQLVWTLESSALSPFTKFSVADLLFLGCSTPFLLAALVRPDRPAATGIGLAFDASLLLALLLNADAYFVLGELVAGNAEQYQLWQTRLLAARGLLVLGVFFWLVRTSRPPWRRLFAELGVAMAVLYGVGAAINLILAKDAYRPGLMDVAWTVPFVVIALSALGWRPERSTLRSPLTPAAPEWRDTRRGTVLALLALTLLPAVHFLSQSMGAPNARLQRLRGGLTFVATFVVGGLFLLRQLYILRRVEEAQIEREIQLRQSQKMEAVGRLAGGVAHDFNNLLTAILGYAGLLLQRVGPSDPLRRHAEQIEKAAERGADLTRQLLAFSRKQVLNLQVVDLGAVVAGTESMLRRLIGENIELVTFRETPLGAVTADVSQLEQVIVNLVVNARDAVAQGGRITITLRNVVLDEGFVREHPGARPGPHVRLAVEDNGVGMTRETQSRLFEPFFTTKEMGRGTGLGLATVYGIVKQSDGYIAVRSDLGGGSAFEIYLPRVEEAVSPPRAERPVASSQGTETVLLVEDEETVRNLVGEILTAAGYRVISAASGAEALERSQAHAGPIHLLLTDVVMPRMSGPQLAKEIAALRPDVRILYTSGYPDDALGPHGGLPPGTAFLAKPLSPDALARRVRQVLDGPTPARGDDRAKVV